ncbi:hypothetical protein Pcinc_042498 [Petrolisthes cinctipes]|uniref:Uncharacterized protein n=1 Tax=Petrolisthes cinctipes TaxID=88211 RepID=A0AAE1BHD0_PETCI|nr:hypothetical protein Pcinc_042498 [Petrolisthes cinctipes]
MASSEQTLSGEGGGGGGGEEAEDEAETGGRELKPSSTAGSSDLDTDTDALDMGDVNGNSTKGWIHMVEIELREERRREYNHGGGD